MWDAVKKTIYGYPDLLFSGNSGPHNFAQRNTAEPLSFDFNFLRGSFSVSGVMSPVD